MRIWYFLYLTIAVLYGSPNVSFPRCRLHVIASTLSLFYRGFTFKFSTKILAAALLFYNVCSPPAISMCRFHVVASTLSLPRCRFHVVASTLLLPRCRFHVIASTLSLPRCRFHVVASTLSLSGTPRNRTQHGGHVLLAHLYNSNFFISLVVRPLGNSWISLQHHGKKAESPEARQHGFTILYLLENYSV